MDRAGRRRPTSWGFFSSALVQGGFPSLGDSSSAVTAWLSSRVRIGRLTWFADAERPDRAKLKGGKLGGGRDYLQRFSESDDATPILKIHQTANEDSVLAHVFMPHLTESVNFLQQ